MVLVGLAAVLGVVPLAADSMLVSATPAGADVVAATISVGGEPDAVAIDDNAYTFVADQKSNVVDVLETDALLTKVTGVCGSTTSGADGLAAGSSADQFNVYVACANSATVDVISLSTFAVAHTIPVGSDPSGIAVTPDGQDVYVANSGSNNVSVISTANNTVVATIPAGSSPAGIAITPNGAEVYVADQGSNTVNVISTSSNLSSAITVGPSGDVNNDVAVTPDGSAAYVTNGAGTVYVIHTATNVVSDTIGGVDAADAIAITPNGDDALVTDDSSSDDSVTNIAIASNTVTGTVSVGSLPDAIAITSDGTQAFVTNSGSGTLSAVDLSYPPGSPTNVGATAITGGITLNWTDPSYIGGTQITDYDLYCSTASQPSTTGTPNAVVNPNLTSGNVTGLVNGTTYNCVVTALNAAGQSAASTPVSATPVATVAGPPTGLNAQGGNGALILTWTDPASQGGSAITGYDVYCATGIASATGTPSTTVTGATTAWASVNGVTNGTEYSCVVTTVNSYGQSIASNLSTAEPEPIPASAPTGLSATAGNEEINLNWTDPTSQGHSAISGYGLYCSTGTPAPYANGANPSAFLSGASVTSGTVTGLTTGTQYDCLVIAFNGQGPSSPSNQVSATPQVSVPDPPSGLSATSGDEEITLNWTDPANDGGTAITGYDLYCATGAPSTGGATSGTAGSSATSGTISGLTDGTAYNCVVTAVNSVGQSRASSQASATVGTPPDPPSPLSAMPGNGSVTLSWTAPSSDGGSVITGYDLYCGVAPPSTSGATSGTAGATATSGTISGLTNGSIYYCVVTAVNAVGQSASSNMVTAVPGSDPDPPTITSASVGNGSITLNWTAPVSDGGNAITGYDLYCAVGTPSTTGATSGTANAFATSGTVSGLTNGTQYNCVVTTVNTIGQSTASNQVSAVPATVPAAPGNTSANSDNGSITLYWTDPVSDGGDAITGYDIYCDTSGLPSTSGAPSGSTMGATATSGTASGLTNGTLYYCVVTAVNAVGQSSDSGTYGVIPGGPPTITSAISGDGTITLDWTDPGSDGAGSAITGYDVYCSPTNPPSTSGQPSQNVSPSSTSATLSGLSDGTTYYCVVAAFNTYVSSVPSNQVSVTPATLPGAPAITSSTVGDGTISLNWTDPMSNGGSPITGYDLYCATGTPSTGATPSGTALGASATSGTVSGLTDGTQYNCVVTAVNSAGQSAPSSPISAIPLSVPGVPTDTVAIAGDGSVYLDWIDPIADGGNAITGYDLYCSTGTPSTAGATSGAVDADAISGTVSGLTNGVLYNCVVTAVNSTGQSAASDQVSATPEPVPSPPTSLVATAGDESVTLTWTDPTSDGGSPITGYDFYCVPSPLTTTMNPPTTGTPRATVSGANATSGTVGGLGNNVPYYCVVTALNAVGQSPPSNLSFAIPSIQPPDPPTLTSAVPGDQSITLTWTDPISDGGSTITGYYLFCQSGGNFEFQMFPGANLTSATVTGLTDGLAYFCDMTAVNGEGQSGASNGLTATPQAPASVPGAPTLTNATAGNATITLTWTDPTSNGGSAITGYDLYCATGTPTTADLLSGSASGPSATSGLASGLTNGALYNCMVVALNAVGPSLASNTLSTTPVVPASVPGAPTLTNAAPGNATITLTWTDPTSNGGSAITGYDLYCATGTPTTAGLLSGSAAGPSATSGTASGLTNSTAYNCMVVALNAVGPSLPSNTLSTTPQAPATVPGAPTLTNATAGNGTITLTWTDPVSNGGSAITGYDLYCATGSPTAAGLLSGSASGPSATSGTASGLTNGTLYNCMVVALNAVGASLASNSLTATPQAPAGVPGAPTLTNATAGNATITLTWTDPTSNGGSAITGYDLYCATGTPTTAGLLSGSAWGPSATSGLASGLTNGTAYNCMVVALNAVGASLASNSLTATPIAPATVPGAPTLTNATAGNGTITLTWTDPTSNGGSAITAYDLYCATGTPSALGRPNTAVGGATATSATITGLTNGTAYNCMVVAQSARGKSGPSNVVQTTPSTVPGAPIISSAMPGNGTITLTWSDPVSNGGSPITGYDLYCATGTPSTLGAPTQTISGASVTSAMVTGLTNGTVYKCVVVAVNADGKSAPSNMGRATPSTVPGALAITSATPGNGTITLTWTDPVSDGGSPITGYDLYCATGTPSTLGTPNKTLTGATVTVGTIAGLTNGTTYNCVVVAVNAAGKSGPSNVASTTPAVVPSAPTNVSATPGNRTITLTWTDPVSNGGSAITGYDLYCATGTPSISGTPTQSVTGASATSATVTGLTNGTAYQCVVVAVNVDGKSGPSSVVRATPQALAFPL